MDAQGRRLWRLYGPVDEVRAFAHFQASLIAEGASLETRRVYGIAVQQFIEYLLQLGILESVAPWSPPTREQINRAVEGYPVLLGQGPKANAKWIRDAAEHVGISKPLAPRSVAQKLAAVTAFLNNSEDLHDEALAVAFSKGPPGLRDLPSYEELIPHLRDTKSASRSEQIRVQQESMLGGVIRNAALKAGKKKRFSVHVPKRPWDADVCAFPIQQFPRLLRATNSFRDKALWTLLLGGGLRTSEGVNQLFCDFDTAGREAYVHDPDRLRGSISFSDFEKIRFKGRNVSRVFFIPFLKDLFFNFLERYLEFERPHLVGRGHDFVFSVVQKGSKYGDPYYLSSDQARIASFKRAQMACGLDADLKEVFAPHSLRHAYGVYMLNYIPLANGDFGLPLPVVQKLMGHETIEATEIYARHELWKIDAMLKAAEQIYVDHGFDFTATANLNEKWRSEEVVRLAAQAHWSTEIKV